MFYFKAILLICNSKTNDLTRIILQVIKEKNPQSVKQLAKILKERVDLEETEITKTLLKLQDEGIIKLESQNPQSHSLANYLRTDAAIWYWLTIAAEAITAIFVFTISEDGYPWIYVRNVLGVIFVLFLPGYAFMKALFPINMPSMTSIAHLEKIERIALSIGMSMAIDSILGLLLYYSPWGLDLTTIVPVLLTFTSVFATASVIREHLVKKPDSKKGTAYPLGSRI